MTTPRKSSALLLLVAFLAFVSIGFPDAVLGVAWPTMRDTFDRSRADLAYILFAAGAGYFSSGILAGKAIELLGVGRLLAASTTAVSLGLFGYAASPGFWPLLLVAAIIGFGSGAVDAGLNFYASEHFSVTVMNLLHAFFGVGAMLGPFVMAGVLATGGSWRIGYAIVASVTLIMAIVFVATSKQWNNGSHHEDGSPKVVAPVREVIGNPLVWLQIVLFFFMTGIEATAGTWAYTSLYERFDMNAGQAGLWAGFYWGAIALGRLVLPTLTRGLAPSRLIQYCVYGLVVSAALMTRDMLGLYQLGLLLFGLAMAPMFPTLMSLTPQRLGSATSLHAIGFQVSAAVLGAACIPSLAGYLSERTDLSAIPWTIFVVAIAIVGIETALRLRTDAPKPVAI